MTGPRPALRRDARAYLTALAPRGGLESAGGNTESALRAAADLASAGARRSRLERLERAFAKADRGRPADPAVNQARAAVLRQAEAALDKLVREPADVQLTADDYTGLEAVIRPSERPSLLVQDGDVDAADDDLDLAPWRGALVLHRELMKTVIASVGRIDRGSTHVGTGFVVAPGVVMTNRHVLQEIAVESPAGGGKTRWDLIGTPTIDFAREYDSETPAEFLVTDVVYAPPGFITAMDVTRLDLALLAVETTNADGLGLPKPLAIRKNPSSATAKEEIFAVGYPARPDPGEGGSADLTIVETLRRVFNMKYGVKRLALGTISLPLGTVEGDAKRWAIGHDATTLGGNSGSCVVVLNDGGPILGLHFGGVPLTHNLAHALPAVPELRDPALAGIGFSWQ